MIPKIIHQVHLGEKELSEKEIGWQSTWRVYNPDWGLFLWDDISIQDLNIRNYDQFKRCKNYSEKSDILRFELLYKFGGLYIDTDFECLRPIAPLIDNRDFVAFKQSNGLVCGAFLAANKNNSLIKKLVNNIPSRELTHGDKDSAHKYGPRYITEILGTKNALDKKYVYPYSWFEKKRSNENFKQTCPEAYAVHHWRGSWK